MKRGRIQGVLEAARREFGRQGGRATGPSKARGDSEHYRKLAAKSLAKRMANRRAKELENLVPWDYARKPNGDN